MAATMLLGVTSASRPLSSALPTLRIGMLASGRSGRDGHNGALLGIEEATHAASLFGGSLTFLEIDIASIDTGVVARCAAILGDADQSHCMRAGSIADRAGAVFLNVDCASDEL